MMIAENYALYGLSDTINIGQNPVGGELNSYFYHAREAKQQNQLAKTLCHIG